MAVFRVRYVLATELINELVEAADDKVLAKTIARYGQADLLGIDDSGIWNWIGGAELLFQVLTSARKKRP